MTALTGGTLFSGIGAPELAMPQVDWRWCAETDPFASAVLAARFPHSRNLGDVTKVDWDAVEPVDIVVFGSPCQSFSVAGKRAGLDDPRGNLALVGLRAVERVRPRWMVWENVPGVLSSDEGRDFGTFLGCLGQCGYGFAYRVLDAQYFGVPQRRRRVFVVGHLGDWRRAAAVLFEQSCLQWNPAPRREAGERVAASSLRSSEGGGNAATNDTSTPIIPVQCNGNNVGFDLPSLRAGNQHVTGGGPAIAFDARQSDVIQYGDGTGPLDTVGSSIGVAFQTRIARNGRGQPSEIVPALNGTDAGATSDMRPCVAAGMAVRRLTPVECERLQGFPDGFTAIAYRGKPAADGPIYRALGNAMCGDVVRWIGERIALVDGP